MENLWYTKQVQSSYNDTFTNLEEVLKKEWFWILSKIDIQEKIKSKLDKNIDKYTILWACNPSLAYKAITAEHKMWLLLPCNIIVYEENNKIYVSSIKPTVAMEIVDNNEIQSVAKQAEEKLIRAIDNLK